MGSTVTGKPTDFLDHLNLVRRRMTLTLESPLEMALEAREGHLVKSPPLWIVKGVYSEPGVVVFQLVSDSSKGV